MKKTTTDRRVIRSKTLLMNALRELMARKRFKYITIKEISDLSTVNRATLYKYYFDKHALLESVFQEDFRRLLEDRTREMKEIDREFLRQIIHAVADFLLLLSQRRLDEYDKHDIFIPLEQKTVQQIIVDHLLNSMKAENKTNGGLLKVKVKAAMAGWAICAAVSQWIELSLKKKLGHKDATIESFSEKIVDPITGLIK